MIEDDEGQEDVEILGDDSENGVSSGDENLDAQDLDDEESLEDDNLNETNRVSSSQSPVSHETGSVLCLSLLCIVNIIDWS